MNINLYIYRWLEFTLEYGRYKLLTYVTFKSLYKVLNVLEFKMYMSLATHPGGYSGRVVGGTTWWPVAGSQLVG